MKKMTRRGDVARALFNRTLPNADGNVDGKSSWYKIVQNAEHQDEAEIFIYDEIGYYGCSAQDFAAALSEIKANTINVRINSPGGSVFDGMAIYRALERHPAKIVVHVDGWAASIASVIMCAGDVIKIAENAYVMIHRPWSFAIGTAEDMRAEADVLDGLQDSILEIYVARTEGDAKAINKQIEAETWFKGQEAVDAGFADEMVPNKKKPKPAAKFGAEFFGSIFDLPEDVRASLETDPVKNKTETVDTAEDAFDFSTATPRAAEAWLRAHGATRKQATDIVVNHFKGQPRDEVAKTVDAAVAAHVTAAQEQAARDEQAKRTAEEQSRDEVVKAIDAIITAAAIRAAATSFHK